MTAIIRQINDHERGRYYIARHGTLQAAGQTEREARRSLDLRMLRDTYDRSGRPVQGDAQAG